MQKARAITMVHFRTNAKQIIESVRKGDSFILTHRGKPAMRLEPVLHSVISTDDPFYRLASNAGEVTAKLFDRIDQTVYST